LCLNLNGCRPLMGLELLWAELVPQKSHDHKGLTGWKVVCTLLVALPQGSWEP